MREELNTETNKRECKIVRKGIEHTEKQLRQLILNGMDSWYCDVINDLLDEAENWCLEVEVLYNKAEIHSINMSKGDT